MTIRFSALTIGCVLLLGACDQPADEQAAAGQQEPQAGEVAADATPAVPEGAPGEAVSSPSAVSGDLNEAVEEGSMAEGSPGGEAVTEQEIPHSDVPPPSREAFTDVSCDFEAWVGKPVDEEAIEETGRVYRLLKPGSMMTMDHSPERINIEHDDNGTVTRVWCG